MLSGTGIRCFWRAWFGFRGALLAGTCFFAGAIFVDVGTGFTVTSANLGLAFGIFGLWCCAAFALGSRWFIAALKIRLIPTTTLQMKRGGGQLLAQLRLGAGGAIDQRRIAHSLNSLKIVRAGRAFVFVYGHRWFSGEQKLFDGFQRTKGIEPGKMKAHYTPRRAK